MQADPLRWKALTVVCAAFFMTILDVSIVNVALPSIGKSLDFSRDDLQWVITAYAITYGGFLLLAGRLADLFGRRRVFLIGVVIFTVASLLCGLAWSEGVLIAARAVQGVGAAVITPSALSIVMTTFEEGAERNKALGIWGALGGGGAAVGVLAGGILTTYLGWEWIFFVNVPVGAIAFLLAPRFVRESRADEKKSLDIAGAVTVTTGLALLVYAVSKAPDHGWGSAWTLIPLGVSVVLLLAFVGIEATTKDPLMPFNIFRIKTVTGANVCGLLLGAITFANFYLLTLYVQIWYTQIPASGSFVTALLPGYLLIGFGLPFTFIPVSIAALAGVSHDEAGLASGLINTTQQIGGAVGIAVCASVSLSRYNHLIALHGPSYYAQALTSGTALAFWVLVVISVAALVAGLMLIKREELAPEAGEALAR